MKKFCQVLIALFGVAVGAATAPSVSSATTPSTELPSIEVLALPDTSFPNLLLANPELASVLLALPGGLGKLLPLPEGLATHTLRASLVVQLQGLHPPTPAERFTVFVAAAERTDVQAVGHGAVALMVVPADGSSHIQTVASAAAEILVANTLVIASPSERASEPLLAVAEALAHTGVLALASLPPNLRPVRSWLEAATARATLERFVTEALDPRTPWISRRAALAAARRPGGASPALSQAAAALLECLGSPGELATRPLALLEAWAHYGGKECPKMPRTLRRAFEQPTRAGIEPEAPRSDVEGIAAAARERLITAGSLQPLPQGDFSPVEALGVAARARQQGAAELCTWLLARPLLPHALTGCREGETQDGYLLSRALPGRGFEISWAPRAGGQHPLALWPSWVLTPTLCSEGTRVCFIDPRGIWSLALDARTRPTLLVPGSFRRLAASPDGKRLAAARWPEAGVWIGEASGSSKELAVLAHAGLAWVDADVLAVADGTSIGLFSTNGAGQPDALAAPGTTAIASRTGVLYLAEKGPAGSRLVRAELATGQRVPIAFAPGEVSFLRAGPDGSLIMATATGLWSWQGEEAARRVSDGLSVAP